MIDNATINYAIRVLDDCHCHCQSLTTTSGDVITTADLPTLVVPQVL